MPPRTHAERLTAMETRCEERYKTIVELKETSKELCKEVKKLNGKLLTLIVVVNAVWAAIFGGAFTWDKWIAWLK